MINEGLALLSMVRQSATALNRPLHLQVEPTSRCNLSCSFCSRLLSVRKGGDMPLGKFKEIFDAVKPRRTTWAGRGEPLLARDIGSFPDLHRRGHAGDLPENSGR
ncbi:MAG: hypothetical protein HYT85_04790 [candidate division NC10 bacterium]|nr:hypothetical protein [candidate division NC10 bacterium]